MNGQASCSECHAPLSTGSVEGLCPQCLSGRQRATSKRGLGWMLILLGGGWVAFWNVLMTPLVVKQLLEPGALNRPSSGEAVGYAIMVVMLTLLGLFVLLAGIGTVWSARKSGVRPPRRGSLSRTVGCALTGCAVAFMVQATPLAAPIYYVVAMFHEIDDTTLSITGLSITAVGAIAGIVVGRRFEAQ